MQYPRPGSGTENRLPVFVFPTSLVFYQDDQSTHKQVVTVYNPYDFTLKYKVLSTAPKKFTVIDTEGAIKSKCCVDIVLRHIAISREAVQVYDKFRIQISEHGSKKIIGRRDIAAVLLATHEKTQQTEDKFESMIPSFSGSEDVSASSPQRSMTSALGPIRTPSSGPNLIVIFAAVVCIAALMMPDEGDIKSSLPVYLQLSQNQKLIAAYVLGLVTMVLFRT